MINIIMNKRSLIIIPVFLLTVLVGFAQDTSRLSAGKHLKNNVRTLNAAVKFDTAVNLNQPHSSVNSNAGITIPATTSGTLNSNVNPSTQLVIPLCKDNSQRATDSGKSIIKHK
jgi:hypothetical protein